MASYDWRCQICENSVSAGNDSCTTCNAPSSMSGDEITSRRNNWQAQQKSSAQGNYECFKCKGTEYEHGQFRASAGGVSAVFEVDNKRFTHITCKNCGYTEFYKNDVGMSESIIDFLIN